MPSSCKLKLIHTAWCRQWIDRVPSQFLLTQMQSTSRDDSLCSYGHFTRFAVSSMPDRPKSVGRWNVHVQHTHVRSLIVCSFTKKITGSYFCFCSESSSKEWNKTQAHVSFDIIPKSRHVNSWSRLNCEKNGLWLCNLKKKTLLCDIISSKVS